MMNHFKYKNAIGITAMHAHLDDFQYKKHAHQEYAMGVTLRGLQSYHLGGIHHLSHTSGVMLFNPEETHDGQSYDAQGLEYIMLYIKPAMLREALGLTTNVKFTTPIIYNPRIS
ncbi:AraC family ligand binding domain-containing protein [Staphylococcus pettenkoferi]|nr:AraC family ligand binding domain-containing protein [Staphylococcus pettenkoferi]MCY1626000.1 AraC family ligand binding domain-containing protein [Staphylococcus pettenkoferi]